jgi:IS30 family transposase
MANQYRQLSRAERGAEIALSLGRSVSTVSPELRRNTRKGLRRLAEVIRLCFLRTTR